MELSTEAIIAVVHTLIRKNVGGARNRDLTPELDLRADLGAHDLDVLQLVMDLEDERHIEIDDDEAEAIKTVGDLEILAAAKVPFPTQGAAA